MTSLIVRRLHGALLVLVTALGVGIAVQPVGAVKVRAEFDKMFDFSQVRTWGWNANAGQVVLARTRDDDPDAFKKRAEPVILDAVNMEMPRRGLKPATGTPDVTLMYYLLLTVSSSAQTLGQFLPSTAQWGLPYFAPSTTSLSVIQQGSLVLDISASGKLVWRGIAEAEIEAGIDEQKRTALIREGVRDILRRFPPK
jgi:hypothetical protein